MVHVMTTHKHGADPLEGQRESGTREDGQTNPPADIDPGTDDRARHEGIPPLPEPDVEGVGNESGPSAEKTRRQTESLPPDKAKMVKDATGF